jgi:hypothetical protein
MTERSSGLLVRLAGVEVGERQKGNWASISSKVLALPLFSWYSRQFDAADGLVDKFVGRAVVSFFSLFLCFSHGNDSQLATRR